MNLKKFMLAFAVLAMFGSPVHAREIVLATWGGTWGKAIVEKAIEPFEKKTGVKVKVISGVSLANVQMISAQRANPKVDIVMLTAGDGATAYQDDLLAPLEPKKIPVLTTLPQDGIPHDAEGHPMLAGMWLYPYGIVYRTDKLKSEIKCWKDLWREDLRNKVGVSSPKYMNGYFLLTINKLAGGTEQDVRPGMERVKALGRNLVAIIDDSAGQQRLLAQQEVWAVPMVSSAAYKMIDEGVPARFVVPCEGAPASMDVIAMVKGGPNPEDASKFIEFYLSPDVIADVTRELKITPVNRAAKITPDHAKYTLTDEELSKLIRFDDQAIVNNRASWQDTWDREIAPMTRR
ncbi:extracellular solute-binding protein [Pusillimonas noertemannii]|uniref:extracellular solute-binding protein n=1 Tax=Pusillimonas noertemannii TaxID=305977 RepID=UPI0002DD0946|nr:extracellular solute-binding protein [Pusillimonas noertemannii]